MKSHTLPVKRRLAPKGILKRLSAVTSSRKQRVAATADRDVDDSGSKISRALTIIFLIHIVAIGGIFIHQRFLDSRTAGGPETTTEKREAVAISVPVPHRKSLPQLASGEKSISVRAGDNYPRIAADEGVDEGDLRAINGHVDIRPGLILKIPPQRLLAVDPPEVVAIRERSNEVGDPGLVEALPVDVSGAPRAQRVSPKVQPLVRAGAISATAPAKTYKVKPGDVIGRIASQFGVNANALMKANGISDARKVKAGMSLVIPH